MVARKKNILERIIKRRSIIFKTYWTDNAGAAHGQEFDCMTLALNHTQELRKLYNFVCLVSENPECVSKMGVADVDKDYNWKKRRI